MKRFMLFAGSSYYPEGGWHDYMGSFDTIEEALGSLGTVPGIDWFHVVDSTTESISRHQRSTANP